jgi:hypothetical protein
VDTSAFTLGFAPLIPAWALILAAALALAFTLYGLLRQARGTLMRLAVALLLLAALANPVARKEDRAPLSDIAIAVVDESPSQ